MHINEVARHIKGYLTVKVEGLYLEKFLNMSVAMGINFWNVKRLGITSIELNLNIKDYKELKRILNKTGCQVSIVKKNGVPFSIFRIRKRIMLGIGFAVFLFLVFILSSFIWSIKIIGTNTISTDDVKKNLFELGVKPGAFKRNLAVVDIENDMLIRMNNISWIKIKIIGTRAEVEVVERVDPPRKIPEDNPCNILARRDAIILKIVAAKGDVLVSPGDPVEKGQKLVTGVIERPNIETRYVHSTANILARTWYDKKAAVPLEKIEKVRTGNRKVKVSIVAGSRQFIIKNPKISYKSYDKIDKSIKLINTDKFEFPLVIMKEEYYETVNTTTMLTPEEAKSKAVDQVEKAVTDSIPSDAKIIKKEISVNLKNNIAIATASVETIEDIGTEEEITR